ncbi:MAG: hypothetical protein A2Z34_02225 [Planctomycetes bacterium RBG_16_59_8]|nr:MAG: hypothetical protein A2Z34_02225 [Planctomycetes bacterium RBG_16_59_8]
MLSLLLLCSTLLSPDSASAGIIDKVAPSIVSIVVERDPEPPQEQPVPGAEEEEESQNVPPNVFAHRSEGPVSGTIVSADGYILTTHFNVRNAKKISVHVAGGKRYDAVLKGYSTRKDLALLKIEATDLPVLPRRETSSVVQGEIVAAIGRNHNNTPSINTGIVSALDRMLGDALQTDARLNYGNVGGALVDMEGRLVGITCNVTIETSARWGPNSGIGFAIPVAMLDKVVPMLKSGVNEGKPGYLGIVGSDDDADKNIDGAKITDVQPGTASAIGGMEADDIIVAFDGKKIENFDQLRKAILEKMVGDSVVVTVRREANGKTETLDLKLTLGERP